MTSQQFNKLAHGTKIQLNANGDTAIGAIVSTTEYNSRGSLIRYNRVKVTEAAADSGWAKYVKRPSQHGFRTDMMSLV